MPPEAFPELVPGSDFKSDGERGDAFPAGSIPVRFRHELIRAAADRRGNHAGHEACSRLTELLDHTCWIGGLQTAPARSPRA